MQVPGPWVSFIPVPADEPLFCWYFHTSWQLARKLHLSLWAAASFGARGAQSSLVTGNSIESNLTWATGSKKSKVDWPHASPTSGSSPHWGGGGAQDRSTQPPLALERNGFIWGGGGRQTGGWGEAARVAVALFKNTLTEWCELAKGK